MPPRIVAARPNAPRSALTRSGPSSSSSPATAKIARPVCDIPNGPSPKYALIETFVDADDTPAMLKNSFVSADDTLCHVVFGAAGTPWKVIVAAFVA